MKKVCALTALLLALLFCLSACSRGELIRPAGELLKPPLYYPEYEDLINTFHKKVGPAAELCIPHSGDYTSAIVLEDLDADDSAEALIFYRSEETESVVNMHYFDLIDNNWISLGDFRGAGTELSSVQTADLDDDGMREIIVLWGVSNVSAGDMLSVYRRDPVKNIYREIATELCVLAQTVDLDSDGLEELFFISPSANGQTPQRYARLMKLSDGKMKLIGETLVDAGVSSYVSVKTDQPEDGRPIGLYVDAMVGEQQMLTEVIYWDAALSQLSAPLLDEKTLTNTQTLRGEPIECRDINRDGRIEIPVQVTLFSDAKDPVSGEKQIYLTEWKSFDETRPKDPMKTVVYTLINMEDDYLIELTEREVGRLGIRAYRETNLWIIYRPGDEAGIGSALFSVIKVPKEQWTAKMDENYITISEKTDEVVCAFITKDGAAQGLTEDMIRAKVRSLD